MASPAPQQQPEAAAAAAEAPTGPSPQAYPFYSPAPGQPFQPYTGQLPEQKLSAPVNKKWETTKIVLHCLGLVFVIAGFAMTGPLMANWKLSYAYKDGIVIDYAPLALVFIWDAAELITRKVRKWKSGIHPGAHVGVSLVLWLLCFLFAFIFCGIEFPRSSPEDQCGFWADVDQGESDTQDQGQGPAHYKQCLKDVRSLATYGTALGVFIFLAGLVHFILFVGACVDTNQRNRAAKRPQIIMVTHPQLAVQGWQPISAGDPLPGKVPAENKEASGAVTEYYAPAGDNAV